MYNENLFYNLRFAQYYLMIRCFWSREKGVFALRLGCFKVVLWLLFVLLCAQDMQPYGHGGYIKNAGYSSKRDILHL